MQALTISVADLLGRPGAYRDIRLEGTLEGVSSPVARLDRPLGADLRAESVVEGVLVTGRVRATPAATCARCLTEFEADLEADVCELFVAPGHDAGPDEDAYLVSGTDIGLEPMLRDVLALALPLRPLCRDDCKGMCAGCGADLNQGACACTEDDADPRWAGLDTVRALLEKRSG